MKTIPKEYYTPRQGHIPVFLSEFLSVSDPVLAFDRFMEGIELSKYLKGIPKHCTGRNRYNPVDMLKTVLFAFADKGYCSLRELEDNCKVNIRYMYLMNWKTPSYRTFGHFIHEVLADNIEEIFRDVNQAIFRAERVDLTHIYIDGTKLEANANKYSWVWKKSTERARYRLFAKITALLEAINEELRWSGLHIETNEEYVPEYLEEQLSAYVRLYHLDESGFVHGKGRHKTVQQRRYEQLRACAQKLETYRQQLNICGKERNSYSKSDHSATFMRLKRDHMGNDRLLPAYNIQIGVADAYIAVADVNHYRSDMDCFVPLMEKFNRLYGFYPEYPVADAGYGSYNNYLYCERHGMKKYMKFPMYEKETKDRRYRKNPFRAENFRIDTEGVMRCPNGKAFRFRYRKQVSGNLYGRQEEVYECEDCSGCAYAVQCKKTPRNRTVRLNEELTAMHREVVENLGSIHGALLRMNRSIQAEGTFGIIKHDRRYRRIVRRGIDSVRLEVFLVSIGHNLYKYYNKRSKSQLAA